MHADPVTRPSLLVRMRNPADAEAWSRFVDLYGPLVYRFARQRGLQDADAADLTQMVFQEVSSAIRRLDYDPARGSFRAWLFTIVRRQLGKFLVKQQRAEQGAGDTDALDRLNQEPARPEAEVWEQQYKRQRFAWAAQIVRASFEANTWQAFWQIAVLGQSASEVAAALGMTIGAVYTAKSRVLDRIRQEIQQLQDE